MYNSGPLTLDLAELERRRRLTRLRVERELERKKFLADLLLREQRALQLRQWVAKIANSEEISVASDLTRLLDWSRIKLLELETSLRAPGIAETLQHSNLFPEHDDLFDPLGDLPPRQPLGR